MHAACLLDTGCTLHEFADPSWQNLLYSVPMTSSDDSDSSCLICAGCLPWHFSLALNLDLPPSVCAPQTVLHCAQIITSVGSAQPASCFNFHRNFGPYGFSIQSRSVADCSRDQELCCITAEDLLSILYTFRTIVHFNWSRHFGLGLLSLGKIVGWSTNCILAQGCMHDVDVVRIWWIWWWHFASTVSQGPAFAIFLLFKWSLRLFKIICSSSFHSVRTALFCMFLFRSVFPLLTPANGHSRPTVYTLVDSAHAGCRQHIVISVVFSEIEVSTVSSSLSGCHCILYKVLSQPWPSHACSSFRNISLI